MQVAAVAEEVGHVAIEDVDVDVGVGIDTTMPVSRDMEEPINRVMDISQREISLNSEHRTIKSTFPIGTIVGRMDMTLLIGTCRIVAPILSPGMSIMQLERILAMAVARQSTRRSGPDW
jgi:hypothetical protein